MTADPLFTAPQTIPGQLAMATDPVEVDAHIGDARNGATAMDRLEDALAAGVPIAALLAAQTDRHAAMGYRFS